MDAMSFFLFVLLFIRGTEHAINGQFVPIVYWEYVKCGNFLVFAQSIPNKRKFFFAIDKSGELWILVNGLIFYIINDDVVHVMINYKNMIDAIDTWWGHNFSLYIREQLLTHQLL